MENQQLNDRYARMGLYDELPLWSAPFGLLLLKHVRYGRLGNVLDIGSGCGFPLLEH